MATEQKDWLIVELDQHIREFETMGETFTRRQVRSRSRCAAARPARSGA